MSRLRPAGFAGPCPTMQRLPPSTIAAIAGVLRPGEAVTVREVMGRLALDYSCGVVRAVLAAMAAANLATVEVVSHPTRLIKRYRLVPAEPFGEAGLAAAS